MTPSQRPIWCMQCELADKNLETNWKRPPEDVLRWAMRGGGGRSGLGRHSARRMAQWGGRGAPALQTDRIASWTQRWMERAIHVLMVKMRMVSYLKVAKIDSRSRWSSSSACSAANVAAKPMHHREAKNPTRTLLFLEYWWGACSGLIFIVPCIPRLAKCNVIAE